MQRGMHAVKLFCHGPECLVDFIHLGGLEEKAAYPEADGLLGIGKVTVAGEHGDQHIRELAAKAGQHGEPVNAGHTDIGEEDIRVHPSDQFRSTLRIIGSAGDQAVIVLPADDFSQTLDNERLIINQDNSVHE